MDAYTWATLLLTPLTGIAAWFAGRKKRALEETDAANETIRALRKTIEECVKKNTELYEEIFSLRKQYADLQDECLKLRKENSEMDGRMRELDTEARANTSKLAAIEAVNASLRKELAALSAAMNL